MFDTADHSFLRFVTSSASLTHTSNMLVILTRMSQRYFELRPKLLGSPNTLLSLHPFFQAAETLYSMETEYCKPQPKTNKKNPQSNRRLPAFPSSY